MVLKEFPVDIFLQVVELLGSETLLNLRLVSHSIHDIITPIALRNVRVFVGVGGEDIDNDKLNINKRLETCSSSLPNLYEHAKHLRISLHAYYASRFLSQDLLPDLWKTITKMRNVTSLTLRWEVRYHETEETMEIARPSMPIYLGTAVDSLLEATGGRLERLTVMPSFEGVTHDWFPKTLSKFRGLKYLKVVRAPGECMCTCLPRRFFAYPVCACLELPITDVLGPLIAANPGIEEMEFVVVCETRGFDPNLILPPTLTKLTSLTIGGLNLRREGSPILFSPISLAPVRNLRHLNTPFLYGPLKLDFLWTAMRDANTTLETLVTQHVSLPLIEYLTSFSGLRSLEIQGIHDGGQEAASQEITSSFLSLVLPRHSATLENLQITFACNAKPIIGWTLDHTNWPTALSALTKLRSLGIHPPIDHSKPQYKPTTAELALSYQSAIDIVEWLPMLETLNLDWIEETWGSEKQRREWRETAGHMLFWVVSELVGSTGRPRVLELLDGRHIAVKDGDEREGEDMWMWRREAKAV